MARADIRLMQKITKFLEFKLNVWDSLRRIQDTKLFAKYAKKLNLLILSGNGIKETESGIDGPITVEDGHTGVLRWEVSHQRDGPGIEVSGIMMVMHTNGNQVSGGDGRTESGLDTPTKSQSTLKDQLRRRNADISTKEWSQDSVPVLVRKESQDVSSVVMSTCGKVQVTAVSSVVNSIICPDIPVKQEPWTNGEESPDVSLSQCHQVMEPRRKASEKWIWTVKS